MNYKILIWLIGILSAYSVTAQDLHQEWGTWEHWGEQPNGTYRNPIIPADYSDLDCIKVGSEYYAITSTFQFSPGMTVMRSIDLVNWEIISHAVPDITQITSELNYDKMNRYEGGIWAGTIRYHNNRFYVYFGTPQEGFFMTSAKSAYGPWEPLTPLLQEKGWDDCSVYWDKKGKGYFIGTNFSSKIEEYKTYMFPMTPDGKKIDRSKATLIHQGGGREANKIIEHEGKFYIIYSEYTPNIGRYVMASRSNKIMGPYKEEKHLLLTNAIANQPNQGGIIEGPNGKWYFFTHHGKGDFGGRQASLLPVTWIDGWPIIGHVLPQGIGTMIWSEKMPIVTSEKLKIKRSDDFSEPQLQQQWHWNYQPNAQLFSLTERPGWMRMKAIRPIEAGNLMKTGNILSQRSYMTKQNDVTTCIDLQGLTEGVHAGLCHYTKQNASVGVKYENGKKFIEYSIDGQWKEVVEIHSSTLWLRSRWGLSGVSYFSYSTDGETFITIPENYQLSWGNYKGDRIGIYCYNPLKEEGYIDVDYLTYIIE